MLRTCEEHDDAIVVYTETRRTGSPCPVCRALADLEGEKQNLVSERDEALDKLAEVTKDLDALQEKGDSQC